MTTPRILVLGANFAGLTAARLIRQSVGDAADVTVVDRKSYLLFVPNIPLEVFAGHDPSEKLHMPIEQTLRRDGTRFGVFRM